MKIFVYILIFISSIIILSGCFPPPRVAKPENQNSYEKSDRGKDESYSRSKELGRSFLKSAMEHYQFVKDPEVLKTVNQIGRRILESIGTNPEGYHFLIVREIVPNAFAVPGGYIFITDGLLEKIKNPDELAGVIAHEIAHIQRGHFFKDEKKVLAIDLATIAAILLSRGNPETFILAQAANIDFQLQFSRKNESEADAYAISYLRKAGYDPAGLLGFFDTLSFYEKFNSPEQAIYFATHPDLQSRMKDVKYLISSKEDNSTNSITTSSDIENWERVLIIIKSLRSSDIDSLLTWIKSSPTLEKTNRENSIHYYSGLAYLKKGLITQAIKEYKNAIEQKDNIAIYHSDLAQCYYLMNNLNDARSEALKSLSIDENSASAYYILGINASGNKEYNEAEKDYKRAIALSPYDFMLYFRLSEVYLNMGDKVNEAYNLGMSYRLDLKPEKALDQFIIAKKKSSSEKEKIFYQGIINEINVEGL